MQNPNVVVSKVIRTDQALDRVPSEPRSIGFAQAPGRGPSKLRPPFCLESDQAASGLTRLVIPYLTRVAGGDRSTRKASLQDWDFHLLIVFCGVAGHILMS